MSERRATTVRHIHISTNQRLRPPRVLEAASSNILCDQKNIWLFPLRVTEGRSWIPTVGVVGATAGLMALDPIEARYFHDSPAYDGYNDMFTSNGTALATLLVPTSLYITGWARKDSKMEHTALLAGEAVADAEIVVTVLKDVTSRERPVSYTQDQNYGDSFYDHSGSKVVGGGGFPSGHAIAAFSIAAVIAHRYREHRWVPYAVYGQLQPWAFQGCRYRHISVLTYLWAQYWDTRSAGLRSFGTSRPPPESCELVSPLCRA